MTRAASRGWTRRVLAGGVAVLLALVGAIYAASERRLRQRYDTKVPSVAVRTDGVSIARGEHLVRAITSCTLCHGEDLGGRVVSKQCGYWYGRRTEISREVAVESVPSSLRWMSRARSAGACGVTVAL